MPSYRVLASSINTSTIERRSDAGALEDATAVTIGITRVSDSAVMLAPTSTGITNASTGLYSYSSVALSLSPTVAYTVTWTFTPAATITVSIPAYDSRRSLRAYRRALVGMNQLGPWSLLTTTSASASADQLVIADLADVDLDTKAHNSVYAYICDGALAGQQRRVKRGGFTASSGTLTMARSFGGTPDTGIDVELLSRLPAIRDELGRTGLRECINWAIEMCPQVIRLEFAGVSGQYQYPLESYPWLSSEVQVGPVYDPATSAGLNPDAHAGGVRLRLNGELPLLEFDTAFATGDTFAVDLMIPGDRWIRTGGAWVQSDAGLVSDGDEALVDRRLVEQCALAFAFRALASLTEPRESDFWIRRAEVQERRAAWIRFWSSARVGNPGAGSIPVGGRSNTNWAGGLPGY